MQLHQAILDNRIQASQFENVGLQSEIRATGQELATLQRRQVGYQVWANEYKNCITIIMKSNEAAESPYISIYGHHGSRRHITRALLTRNQGSILFAERDALNSIAMYNYWQEHGAILINPNRSRHFRLDAIN